MALPFQTETFTPDDPALLQRVQGGQRLTHLYLGATVYLVDGVRWIVVGNGGFKESRGPWLAYPLPESYGLEHVEAIKLFESVWRMAAEKIRPAVDRYEPVQAAPPPPPPPKVAPRKLPKGRVIALAGAVPLPGLEPWTVIRIR